MAVKTSKPATRQATTRSTASGTARTGSEKTPATTRTATSAKPSSGKPAPRAATRATAPAVAKPARRKAPARPRATPTATATKKSVARPAVTRKTAPAKKNAQQPVPFVAETKTNVKPAKGKKGKLAKIKKPKLVRDSFTMPDSEYAVIAQLKKRCLNAGVAAKKSEILRAAVANLAKLGDASVLAAVRRLDVIKTGRPVKGSK